MIQANGTINGRPMILLGLSGENVTRLTNGEPIKFQADHLGFSGIVVIVYGRTEEEIKKQLRKAGKI